MGHQPRRRSTAGEACEADSGCRAERQARRRGAGAGGAQRCRSKRWTHRRWIARPKGASTRESSRSSRRARLHVEELVASRAPAPYTPLLVVLDGIEDPHNLGAILRTVDAAGAHGVVRQARHAAAIDGVAAKASAGAVSYVNIATVVNIARALEELKEAGVWRWASPARRAIRTSGRLHAPHRAGGGGRGGGAPPVDARAVRSAGPHPDGRIGLEPECVGGNWNCTFRGGASTAPPVRQFIMASAQVHTGQHFIDGDG